MSNFSIDSCEWKQNLAMKVKLGEQLQNLSEHLLQEIFYLINFMQQN